MKIKSLLMVISAIILISSISFYSNATNSEKVNENVIIHFLSGDADRNEVLTAADARLILRASAKLETIQAEVNAFCDLNNDYKITSADARLILRKAAKLENGICDIKMNKLAVDKQDSQINTYEVREKFDLESVITADNKYNTIIVKGKIVDLEEYKISWTDENNENWGPFARTIITVETDAVYHGNFSTEKNTIKILYPHSLSKVSDKSVIIEKGKEYVFANCWMLDEKYEQQNKNSAFYGYDKSLILADAIIGGAWNSMMPVENNTVTLYHEYLNAVEDVDKMVVPFNAETATRLTNPDALKSGYFISVGIKDFESALSKILASVF